MMTSYFTVKLERDRRAEKQADNKRVYQRETSVEFISEGNFQLKGKTFFLMCSICIVCIYM